MSKITLLDPNTINQIAAGEVVERPAGVVKELVENAIDAAASHITVEIKEGGLSFLRITDNGGGIEKEDITAAFKRHSTSKIKTVTDLLHISSLGFRGEALSSIAAIAQAELITKTRSDVTGCRYTIEGGEEKTKEDIGCPDGTTIVVRNLFYNTPARKKFLKSAMTEAGYINELIDRLCISHPEISFKFLSNNQLKINTSGNGNLKDVIYHVYGREIAAELIKVSTRADGMTAEGYIGKPVVSRGNRNYMNYFINGRYIKSTVISKAIEDAYKPYSMQHRYPFTAVHYEIPGERMDVNVHPTKMEVRFTNSEALYQMTYRMVTEALQEKELIPAVTLESVKENKKIEIKSVPEPFEQKRLEQRRESTPLQSFYVREDPVYQTKSISEEVSQPTFFETKLLSGEGVKKHRIIGQLFKTYWLVELEEKLFLIDQHAAHEKVLYEKTMKAVKKKEFLSQMIEPPIILTLNMREEAALKEYMGTLKDLGFEIGAFGGREYSVRGVPADMLGIAQRELLIELIDSLAEEVRRMENPDIVLEKAALMSCKAAIKANHLMSVMEAEELIGSLLELENPYHCPHGRPVIISMSKYEIEKKFKRIV